MLQIALRTCAKGVGNLPVEGRQLPNTETYDTSEEKGISDVH